MLLRASKNPPTRRVLVHGLFYCGQMFAEYMSGNGWEFRYFPDRGTRHLASMASYLKSIDLAYQIGGRITLGKFLLAARLLNRQKIVMHWVGSDAKNCRPISLKGKGDPWVMRAPQHWGVSEWIVREVAELGVSCELVPLPAARAPRCPSDMPSRFSALVYVPDSNRSDLYGLDQILSVARELPSVPFELVGLQCGTITDAPKNLRIHGRIGDLTEFYRNAVVVWRPTRHDGLSQMVMEALGHGRHVLWSYPFPGCLMAENAQDACEHISRLQAEHSRGRLGINRDGVDAMANDYFPQRVKRNILTRLEKILSS